MPVVQALGLEQRILASPRGRPLDHQSGRKAGNVRLRPHGGLQEPCLHAPEGLRGSHFFEQLRRFEIIKAKRDLGIFFSSVRLSEDLNRGAPTAGGEFGCCAPALQCARSRSLSMISLRPPTRLRRCSRAPAPYGTEFRRGAPNRAAR